MKAAALASQSHTGASSSSSRRLFFLHLHFFLLFPLFLRLQEKTQTNTANLSQAHSFALTKQDVGFLATPAQRQAASKRRLSLDALMTMQRL